MLLEAACNQSMVLRSPHKILRRADASKQMKWCFRVSTEFEEGTMPARLSTAAPGSKWRPCFTAMRKKLLGKRRPRAGDLPGTGVPTSRLVLTPFKSQDWEGGVAARRNPANNLLQLCCICRSHLYWLCAEGLADERRLSSNSRKAPFSSG